MNISLFSLVCHTLTTTYQFETASITIQLGNLKQMVDIHRKVIMDWVNEVLQDPYLYCYVHWYPKKVFVQHGDSKWIWCIDEPWTGDELWDAWVEYFYFVYSIASF